MIRIPQRHRQTDGQTGNLPWHNRALRVKISIKTTKMEVGIKRKQQRNIPVIRITLPTFNINNIMLIIIVVYGVRQVAYFGSVDKVVTHFSSLGLHCAPHYNPADFISTSSSFTSLSTTCVSCDVSVIVVITIVSSILQQVLVQKMGRRPVGLVQERYLHLVQNEDGQNQVEPTC